MSALIQVDGYIRKTSRYDLASSAFDVVNYRNGLTANVGLPGNTTMTSDTPNGVLSGSVAALSATNPWEVVAASYNTLIGAVLGLFMRPAAGQFGENNIAAAGGKIAVMLEGECIVSYFETNTSDNGYASILGSYTLLSPLFVSPFGLLTPLKPGGLSNVYTSSPVDQAIGICTKVPTSSDLTLGVRLFEQPMLIGQSSASF